MSNEHSPLLGVPSQSSLLKRSRTSKIWRRSLSGLNLLAPESDHDKRESYKEYDSGLQAQLAEKTGVRTWTSNFESIDWLHDEVKEHLRKSRLRQRKGLRALLLNAWDRLQGYIVVSLVGLLTALFAFGIVRSEAWLFDFKDGYCTTGFSKNKRLCCPHSSLTPAFITLWKKHGPETCADWRTWAEVFNGSKANDIWAVDYASEIAIGLCFAILSSILTVYLSSSANVMSSKELSNSSAKNVSRKVAYFAAGSGIPEVKSILSGFVIRGYLGFTVLFTKAVGLTFSVASGLSLGKEGPMVQIACCIANLVTRLFPKYDTNEAKRREILSAACSAGVSVAFGSPVGGVLFSLEETSYYFGSKTMIRCLWSAAVAYLVLKMLNPFGTGSVVLFEITYDRSFLYIELIGYAFLGVLGGLYGAAFNRLNFLWSSKIRNKSWMARHPILEVACITSITLLVAPFNPFTQMGGTELVAELFSECHADSSLGGLCVWSPSEISPLVGKLLLAAFLKSILTVVTFGIKVPAGIFIPTLAVGALLGRVCGLLVELSFSSFPQARIFEACLPSSQALFGQQCVLPGVWAIVGAAATLSGVTRTTVSLGIIVAELTGSILYVIPVLLAVLVAKTVADMLEPMSIYDLVLQSSQLPYLDSKTEYIHTVAVAEVVDSRVPTIDMDADNTIESLSKLLTDTQENARACGFPLLLRDGNDQRAMGYIGINELRFGLEQLPMIGSNLPCSFKAVMRSTSALATPGMCDLGMLVDRAPMSVSLRSPMELLHQLFIKLGVRYLIITDDRGCYVGTIERISYIAYLAWVEHGAHSDSVAQPVSFTTDAS